MSRYLPVLVILLLSAVVVVASPRQTSAQGEGGSSLAAEYAPVLHFAAGEKFYPTTVDYLINSSNLMLRGPNGTSDTLISTDPTPSDLGSFNNSNYFLENRLNSSAAIAADYDSKATSLGYYAYVHEVNTGNGTVIQYWLFYAYNLGQLNDHQGDLEVVQVFLSANGTPERLLLSQHGSGENAAWSDVETSSGHPVVYVAQGSHANYFRSYQGELGFEDDIVNANGLTITPNMLNLVMLGEPGNVSASQSWLNFPGRWGYWGTADQVAQGDAGMLGPVFNQGGIRWAQPDEYLSQTLPVNGTYFDLAELAGNFLLIFAAYVIIRAAWKIFSIVRMKRKTGLYVGRFLRGKGGVGVLVAVVGILITIVALVLPWYTVTASSQAGPLAGAGTTLMSVNGITGLNVQIFTGTGDASSGLTTLFTTQVPFAVIYVAGLVLLFFDIVGVKSGKKLGGKLIRRGISALTPLLVIYAFMAELPSLVPFASGLLPGTNIPSGVIQMVDDIASRPYAGSTSQTFPVVGVTTVNWGYSIGAYLFIVAAVVMIVAAHVMRGVPSYDQTAPAPVPAEESPPPAQGDQAASAQAPTQTSG
ncbi:MAG TPA: Vps62-related protein [Nitrososphaerales archaeon]|nr:Vps62-related protein [Nitrososphaerales archaeon]